MTGNPSLVFVPGAWHTAEYWGKVKSAMESHKYRCTSVTLPTTQSTSTSVNFSHDVKAVQDAIVAETAQGFDVVVAVHSYGGAVGSSAMKGFTQQSSDNASTGDTKTGRVIGLFMVATGFVYVGKSFLEAFGGKPPPTWEADYENNIMTICVDPIDMLYHDLPEEEAKEWVGKLTPNALTSCTTGYEVSYEGWRDVPAWLIMTKEDRAFPFEAQKMISRAAEKAGAMLTKREIDSSHSPMLSKPGEVVDFLLEAIAAFTT
ncbi:Alpha/beta hydrolase fold-1 [Fusarium tricinctum]|uniref:Alpha/beta hydrolase fold-1 n=1 Tax=Fusarium tricinctum TaxID=61284 RepID=A0A8K0RLY7_9HYPO|nr:Alpha/beta hydrolase fold-1 [Fusarium tricinctum]